MLLSEILSQNEVIGYNFIDDFNNQILFVSNYDTAIKIVNDELLWDYDRIVPIYSGETIID
jgi:hypothetical protein